MSKPLGEHFVVRWRVRVPGGAVQRRDKRFPVADFDAMSEFMAGKIADHGIRSVALDRYNALGIRVNRPQPRQKVRRESGDRGCPPTLAATLETEDFGSFAGIS